MFSGVFSNVVSNFHGTEMRPAHGAEVRGLRALLWQGFVVELAHGFGIEREIELIFPSKLTRLLQQSSPLRAGR
jgi:hypothetical protein